MTRIYVVKAVQFPESSVKHDRLVRANSQRQAIQKVIEGVYTAHVADQAELVSLLTAGVRVENGGSQGTVHAELANVSGSLEGPLGGGKG